MSSQRVKKELYETAMTGEKALTSLMYVQMTLYAAKSQKTYARVRSEGRARMRHMGLHMNQYLRAAGKDLESFRNRLKETHLPEGSVKGRNISGPDGTCAGCDGEKTDVPQGTDRDGRESKGNSRTDRGAAEKHAGAWSISHRLAGSA